MSQLTHEALEVHHHLVHVVPEVLAKVVPGVMVVIGVRHLIVESGVG